MKKFTSLLLASFLLLSLNSCEWFNTTILGKPSKAEIAMKIQREKIRQDSLKNVEALAAAQMQEQEAANALQQEAQLNQRYHVMVGCFKVAANADRMMGKLQEKGYHPVSMKFKNGFTCISVQAFADVHAAYNAMQGLMKGNNDFCPDDIWVYDNNQQLH